jgi:tetratricopeptide (TPR) repeat protein
VQLRFGPSVHERRVAERRAEELQMAANTMRIVSASRNAEFETWIEQAEADLAHGQYAASADLYALALAREPYDVRARTGLRQARHAARLQEADTLIQAGDHEGAAHALEQALVIVPEDSASAERLLAERRTAHAADRTQSEIARRFQAGIDAYAQQRFVDAVHHFDEVLRLDRHHAAAASYRKQARAAHEMRVRGGLRSARALVDAGDYDQARAVLHQLLELIPQNSEARKLLALADSRAEAARRAESEHLGTSGEDSAPAPVSVGPEVSQLYDQGMQLYRSGDLVGAMRAWEDVARRAPHFAEVDQYLLRGYRVTGLESYTEGRLREAVDIWEKALQLEPDNEQLRRYVNQAQAKLARAQSSEASGRP